MCCFCFINLLFNDTISISKATTNDRAHTDSLWCSWVSSMGGCCRRANPSTPTRLQTDSEGFGEAGTPQSPLPGLQASSFAQGLLFVPRKLSGSLRPCPSSGLRCCCLLLMKNSDFRSLRAFPLLANERLWPEETLRLLLLFCSPDVNCLPLPLLLCHSYFDLGLLPNLLFLPYGQNQVRLDFLRLGPPCS